jgi:mercuric ion binding protein
MSMDKIQRTAAALGLLWLTAVHAAPVYWLKVDGLACPFCAYGIEKRLSALEGVERVEVDIKGGRVAVTLREGAQLTEPQARRAVAEAGFTLRGFNEVPRP